MHAVLEASRTGILDSNNPHPHIVFCKTNNLQKEIDKLNINNIQYNTFIEPDLDNSLTAIATEPIMGDGRKLFNKLQLVKG